jgi:hypothetical protein
VYLSLDTILQVSMYIEAARYLLLRAGQQPYVRKYGARAKKIDTYGVVERSSLRDLQGPN